MYKDEFVLEIPYGTRDFLPQEAAEKRVIETALADTFAKWGYDEVVTPTIEYLDTLTIGNGSTVEPHMFKFLIKQSRHWLRRQSSIWIHLQSAMAVRLSHTCLSF